MNTPCKLCISLPASFICIQFWISLLSFSRKVSALVMQEMSHVLSEPFQESETGTDKEILFPIQWKGGVKIIKIGGDEKMCQMLCCQQQSYNWVTSGTHISSFFYLTPFPTILWMTSAKTEWGSATKSLHKQPKTCW